MRRRRYNQSMHFFLNYNSTTWNIPTCWMQVQPLALGSRFHGKEGERVVDDEREGFQFHGKEGETATDNERVTWKR